MSDNVRVYEIAEESGASSTEVIRKAKDLGIELKSPQSALSFEDAEEIANYIMTGKSGYLQKAKDNKVKEKITSVKTPTEKIKKAPNPNKKPIIPHRRGLKIVKKKSKKEDDSISDHISSVKTTDKNKSNIQESHLKDNSGTNLNTLDNVSKQTHVIRKRDNEIIEYNTKKVTDAIKNINEIFPDANATITLNVSELTKNLDQPISIESHIDNKDKQKNDINNIESSDVHSKKQLVINRYPSVEIEIRNLKTIKHFKWNLKKQCGVYGIIGENGSGKSSLLISIGKLIEKNIFHLELTGTEHYKNTEIKYNIDGHNFTWIKNKQSGNNWRQLQSDTYTMPKLKGFIESSVLSGTRFKKVEEDLKNLDFSSDDTLEEVNSFITNSMNQVLYGKKKSYYKFEDLYKITATRQRNRSKNSRKKVLKTYSYYALKKSENEYIQEHLFSTGEYFLLKLLDFIEKFNVEKKNVSIIPALIVIDEIELSLHPLAQTRLIELLNRLAEDLNLIVIFASHSLHILDYVKPENTYFIENDKTNIPHCTNPIGKGFLSSKLNKYSNNDFIILVEDDLAKSYVKCTLDNLEFTKIFKTAVIPIGGSHQVIKAAMSNHQVENMYGDARVMVALDEDAKTQFKDSHRKFAYGHHIPVEKNIEHYIMELISQEHIDFTRFIDELLPQNNFYDLEFNVKSGHEVTKTDMAKEYYKQLISELARKTCYLYGGNAKTSRPVMAEKILGFVYQQHKDTTEHKKFEKEIKIMFGTE